MNRQLWLLLLCVTLLAAACDGDTADETVDGEAEDPADEPAGDSEEAAEGEDDGQEAGVEPGEDWPDELVFTLTPSQEQQAIIEDAAPLAEMLEERLGVAVEPLVPTDYSGVIVALQSEQADVAGGLGPRQMVQAEEEAGAELILQSERFGELVYVTQWFTNDPDTFCEDEPVEVPNERAEEAGGEPFLFCNGVDEAEDSTAGPLGEDVLPEAAGRSVAYVDQGSTSGFSIPALQLLEAGVDPEDDVDAIFSGGHDNSVLAVYEGDADVGLSYNDAREDVVEQAPDVGQEVVVFGWSEPIPNDGFAARGDLPDDLVEAITEAFVDIASTEEGAELLFDLYTIDDLVEVDSDDFDVIRELEAELGERLED